MEFLFYRLEKILPGQREIHNPYFFGFGFNFLTALQDYFDFCGLPYNTNDINFVCNVNSPGKFKLFSQYDKVIVAAALFTFFVVGGSGTFKFGDKNTIDLRVDGVIKSITKYKNQSLKRELIEKLKEQSDSLEIKSPTDINSVLKSLDSH